jgi:hypothetical protein
MNATYMTVNYLDKYWDNSTIKPKFFLLELKINNSEYTSFKLAFWQTHEEHGTRLLEADKV